jgi:hypothetical protein
MVCGGGGTCPYVDEGVIFVVIGVFGGAQHAYMPPLLKLVLQVVPAESLTSFGGIHASDSAS